MVFALLLSVGAGYATSSVDRADGPLVDVGGGLADAVGNAVGSVVRGVVPDVAAEMLFMLLPAWVGYPELGALSALVATLVGWAVAEAHWAGWTVEAAVDWVTALRGE